MAEHSQLFTAPTSSAQRSPALVLRDVVKTFAGRTVSHIPHLELGRYGVEGLVGPNGAGKTTLTKLITGALPLDAGSIVYHGPGGAVQVSGLRSHRIAQLGVVKSNQVIQDFESLTIRDSLLLAVTPSRMERFYRVLGSAQPPASSLEEIDWYLDHFGFTDPDRRAMSGGEKKLLDIIRCLLVKPRFLLLDEPTAGLPEAETEKVKQLVRDKADSGEMAVLIIEHDLDLMWSLCDYVHFLAEGRVLLQGPPEEIRNDPTVIEKYLGVGHA
jgi:ABC-type branched-subunit amino acid transport system ATPase component